MPLSILYYLTAIYYRRTSVEAKRLDSMMRSALYSSYSGEQRVPAEVLNVADSGLPETLTGLSTVRAYKEQV